MESEPGEPFQPMLEDSIHRPLDTAPSSLLTPMDSTDGVMPIDESASSWDASIRDDSPRVENFSPLQ